MNAGGNVDILAESDTFTVRVDGNPVAGSGTLGKVAGSSSQYQATPGAYVVVVGLCNDGSSMVLFDDTV